MCKAHFYMYYLFQPSVTCHSPCDIIMLIGLHYDVHVLVFLVSFEFRSGFANNWQFYQAYSDLHTKLNNLYRLWRCSATFIQLWPCDCVMNWKNYVFLQSLCSQQTFHPRIASTWENDARQLASK
jgi:hypothetical protein